MLLLLLLLLLAGTGSASGQQQLVTVQVCSGSGYNSCPAGTCVSHTLIAGACSPHPDPSVSTYVRSFCVAAGSASTGPVDHSSDSVMTYIYADSACGQLLATLVIAPNTCSSGQTIYSCAAFSSTNTLPTLSVATTGSYSACPGMCNPQCGTIYVAINICVTASTSSSLRLSCDSSATPQRASVTTYSDASCTYPAGSIAARSSGSCMTQRISPSEFESSVVTCPIASVAPVQPSAPAAAAGGGAAATSSDTPAVWSDAVTVCFGCGVGVTVVTALLFVMIHQWGDCCAFPPHPDSWASRPDWSLPGTSDGDSAFLFSILMRLGVLGAMIAALVLDGQFSLLAQHIPV